jgi:hypothetical protein
MPVTMTPALWSSKPLLKVAPLGGAVAPVVAGVVAAGPSVAVAAGMVGGGGAAVVLDELLWIT